MNNNQEFTPKILTEHQTNNFNKDYIEVKTNDLLDQTSNACHNYRIDVVNKAQTSDSSDQSVYQVDLRFQQGSISEVGANGITDQALLAIVLDRLRGFNSGKFANRNTALAITHLEDALFRLGKRSEERVERKVDGERIV